MKKILVTLLGCGLFAGGVVLPRSATAEPELTAVGTRDASGARTGDYKIVDAAGRAHMQGRFEKDKLEGEWSFFDSQLVKIAVITYHAGVPTGSYRTYFSSKAGPSMVGKPMSEGSIQNDAVVGHFCRYAPEGKAASKAFFEGGDAASGKAEPDEVVMSQARTNPSEMQAIFTKSAKMDLQFIHALDGILHEVVH